jgi:iron(III) transport system permease protein
VMLTLWLEQASRQRLRYYHAGQSRQQRHRTLSPLRSWSVLVLCAVPVGLGFVLPTALLAQWA